MDGKLGFSTRAIRRASRIPFTAASPRQFTKPRPLSLRMWPRAPLALPVKKRATSIPVWATPHKLPWRKKSPASRAGKRPLLPVPEWGPLPRCSWPWSTRATTLCTLRPCTAAPLPFCTTCSPALASPPPAWIPLTWRREKALRPNTKVVETPANPTMRPPIFRRWRTSPMSTGPKLCGQHLMTPYFQRPGTGRRHRRPQCRHINGHGDVVAGLAIGPKNLIDECG